MLGALIGYCFRPPPIPDESTGVNSTAKRIFRYAGTFEYALQGIAILASIASGAGIALQNLIFGQFVTVITDYVSQVSSRDAFLDGAAELA